jgi:hypothetical protein
VLLAVVFGYVSLLFNPKVSLSTSKADDTLCPDGYAYKVETGHYIACEDFDLFHVEQHGGVTRTDLYIDSQKPTEGTQTATARAPASHYTPATQE